jgi:hypothetical protein
MAYPLRYRLTLFYILLLGLVGLGLELWVVGAVFTFPVTLLATVYVYRKLKLAA